MMGKEIAFGDLMDYAFIILFLSAHCLIYRVFISVAQRLARVQMVAYYSERRRLYASEVGETWASCIQGQVITGSKT